MAKVRRLRGTVFSEDFDCIAAGEKKDLGGIWVQFASAQLQIEMQVDFTIAQSQPTPRRLCQLYQVLNAL